MKVHRVQIEHQLAKIKVDSQRAVLNIEMPRRKMQVEQNPPQMQLISEQGKIKLDLTNLKNSLGLKSFRDWQEEFANQAKAQAKQGTLEITKDAAFVGAMPPDGSNRIAELALSKMLEVPPSNMNSGAVPEQGVIMQGVPGEFEINWSTHDVKINWDNAQGPNITVEPKASVDVYLAQKPAIQIEVVEETIPAEVGNAVDTQV